MTTAGSTATLPEVRTAPPVNGRDLLTHVTHEAAKRPDGKNLLIRIDVRADEAVFDCEDPENVGNHEHRFVLFCANKHCWLKFGNPSVFVEPFLELMAGEKTPAYVPDGPQKAKTTYCICVSARTAKTARMKAVPLALHGPVIVVP